MGPTIFVGSLLVELFGTIAQCGNTVTKIKAYSVIDLQANQIIFKPWCICCYEAKHHVDSITIGTNKIYFTNFIRLIEYYMTD